MPKQEQAPYKMGAVIGAFTLDARQANALSVLLEETENDVLDDLDKEAVSDVKRRIDEAMGFVEAKPTTVILDGDSICVCGSPLMLHFPHNPEGCEGFRGADS